MLFSLLILLLFRESAKQARNEAQIKFDRNEMELAQKSNQMEQQCEYEDDRSKELKVKKKQLEDSECSLFKLKKKSTCLFFVLVFFYS